MRAWIIDVRVGGAAAPPPGLKNFRANSVFRASASCSNILNDKKYMFNTVKNSRATLFFRASASCSKIVNCEKIFNTVYIHLGAIRVIWAGVVCNQDQRRDWL